MELQSSSTLSQSERLIKINRLNSSSFNVDIIHEDFRDLVQKSINYPSSIQVVRQDDEFGHEYLETLDDALQQFFQYRPTDDQILQDPNQINHRKDKILSNLCEEVENIQIIIQSVGSLDYQEIKDFQLKQGSKLSIHLKNIFDKDVVNANFGMLLNSFLTSCYILLKDFISHIKGEVQQITFDQLADFQSEYQQQSLLISDRSSRFAVKRLDETIDVNKQLEESRQELNRLEISVLKIAILLERINYYTMGGVIRLRDQNLNIIPFFESTEPQNNQYDLQSCLKISSVIRKQIECLEEIEIQEWNSINAQKKLKKSLPKIIRNYKTIQKQIADVAVADDIYKEIWSSFCKEETKKQLSDIKVYMQLKVTQFKTPTYKVTFKLYQKTAATSQYRECAITSMNDSWIFTELPFFDSLVKDELILVIYAFGLIDEVDIEKNQVYQNKSVQKLRFVKAVSLINLSDTFFEKGMKDGYQAELGKIRFDSFDKEWPIDSQFAELQKKIADQRRKAPDLDVAFNRSIKLEMQLAFFTSIYRNQFLLRQDQSQLVRQDRFWQYIVKPKTEDIPPNDNQAIYNHEIERMNLQVLKQNKNEF